MMQTADYARVSDPEFNPAFCRRWTEPHDPPTRTPQGAPTTLDQLAAEVLLARRKATVAQAA
jgi:hypothetical protein